MTRYCLPGSCSSSIYRGLRPRLRPLRLVQPYRLVFNYMRKLSLLTTKDILENEKMYLRPELSLALLSRVVGTNTVYLSKAINRTAGCSFNTLVNRYRIAHLIRAAEESGENIERLAAQYGFWSRSTFYDVFRQQTGVTPHRYMQRLAAGDAPQEQKDESKEIQTLNH